MSLSFSSLSQSSWYRITRPKATFRQIKTYFVSCLLDGRQFGWYCVLVWPVCSRVQKNIVFIFLKFVAFGNACVCGFFFFVCVFMWIRAVQEGLILWHNSKSKRTACFRTLNSAETFRWKDTWVFTFVASTCSLKTTNKAVISLIRQQQGVK